MTELQKKAAKDCFDFNPNLNEVLVTSDGSCFTSSNLCANHVRGANLDPNDTVTIKRSEFAVPATATAPAATTEGGEKKEADLSKMNKLQLQGKCTELSISFTEEMIKADLIKLIEEKQASENASGAEVTEGGAGAGADGGAGAGTDEKI